MTLYTVKQVWDGWLEVQDAVVNAGFDMSDFSETEFPRMIADYLAGDWEEVGPESRQTTLDEFYEEE